MIQASGNRYWRLQLQNALWSDQSHSACVRFYVPVLPLLGWEPWGSVLIRDSFCNLQKNGEKNENQTKKKFLFI